MNQIERIMEVTGRPSDEDMVAIRSERAPTMLECVTVSKQISLVEIFPAMTAEGREFMSNCISFNPDQRMSSTDGLAHPFVADFHDTSEEPTFPDGSIRLPVDDSTKMTAAEYRDRLYQEITLRRREGRKNKKTG